MSIATTNPIEIRTAGLKALNAALGLEGTQAFLLQYSGAGDFTKDRHEFNPKTHEEIAAGIAELQEALARGEVDMAGCPITSK